MKFLITISFSLLLALTACGGNKIVTTTDDSADYQLAIQLPPLSKNASTDSTSNTGQALDSSSAGISDTDVKADQLMTASIIEGGGDTMRVRIDAEINTAWPYFLNKLRTSGVTIHRRNNEGHRVEVGCSTMDDGADRDNQSGWSIFNRENTISEYCSMELSTSRNATLVSVHDRQGKEVRGDDATTLLNKIVSQ